MASPADLKQAKAILRLIPQEPDQYRQRLLLAAAIHRLDEKTVVVGGTAEQYWAGGEYRPTDLDMVPYPGPDLLAALGGLGFGREGRHWVHPDLPVAVEFPDSGDAIQRRVSVEVTEGIAVPLIGVEDLYLDRVKQATAGWPQRTVSFLAAVEVALVNWNQSDWEYVAGALREFERREPAAGRAARAVHNAVQRLTRRMLVDLETERIEGERRA